jgi:hypothetical protein
MVGLYISATRGACSRRRNRRAQLQLDGVLSKSSRRQLMVAAHGAAAGGYLPSESESTYAEKFGGRITELTGVKAIPFFFCALCTLFFERPIVH